MITYLVSQNYFLKLKEHYISQVLFEIDFFLIGVYVLFRKKKKKLHRENIVSQPSPDPQVGTNLFTLKTITVSCCFVKCKM